MSSSKDDLSEAYIRGLDEGIGMGSEQGYSLGYSEATEKMTQKLDTELQIQKDKMSDMENEHTTHVANIACHIRDLHDVNRDLRKEIQRLRLLCINQGIDNETIFGTTAKSND